MRVADGMGVHAVIAPKDRAVGLNATVRKVASGAAESVPFIVVTNLARTIRQLKEQGVLVVGTAEDGAESLYQSTLSGPIAVVLGSEGSGLRRLTRDVCDLLIKIPMLKKKAHPVKHKSGPKLSRAPKSKKKIRAK